MPPSECSRSATTTRERFLKELPELSYTIRPLRPEDYPATTEIYNAQNEPHHQLTTDELRQADRRALARGSYHLLTGTSDGKVIARGQVGVRADDDAPGKFWAWFFVHNDHVGRGADTAMYDAALELLADHEPKSLWTCIREDFVPRAAYLADKDYEEQFRSWGAHLELGSFDAGPFRHYADALIPLGIELVSYAQLDEDPDRNRKLADLQAELEDDAPHNEPIIPKNHPTPQDPATGLDSFVVAVHGAEYVGMASLTRQQHFPDVPGSGLVGVRRAYRNQGIGTALVAHTSAWAKTQGFEEVNMGGGGANAPMLKVIRRLGFDVEPAWVTFAKFL